MTFRPTEHQIKTCFILGVLPVLMLKLRRHLSWFALHNFISSAFVIACTLVTAARRVIIVTLRRKVRPRRRAVARDSGGDSHSQEKRDKLEAGPSMIKAMIVHAMRQLTRCAAAVQAGIIQARALGTAPVAAVLRLAVESGILPEGQMVRRSNR